MNEKILAFGEVMMRLEVPGSLKISQSRELKYSFSGTGVNVLSGLSGFGHKGALVSALPTNSLGDAAISSIRSLGIETSHIVRQGHYMGMYFLEHGFGIRASNVTYTNRMESSFCQSVIEDYDLDEMFKDAKAIHFCGISLAVSDSVRKLVIAVAEEAKRRGLIVIFDCNYRPKLWGGYEQAKPWYERMLSLADICFMTEKDALGILRMGTKETQRTKLIESLLAEVMSQYTIQTIAGTIRDSLSAGLQQLQGFILQAGTIEYSKPYSSQVLDRIGGGDGFVSGLLHGLFSRYSTKETIEFATASGVFAHTIYGDSLVATVDDIVKLMNNRTVELER